MLVTILLDILILSCQPILDLNLTNLSKLENLLSKKYRKASSNFFLLYTYTHILR